MLSTKMHADEVATDADLVRRLLAAQFPQWAALALEPVPSAGTDNAIYRLGQEMVVRLPRIGWAVAQVEKEHLWLPRLAPQLPLELPVPLAKGAPAEGYPFPWSVYRWLEGENRTINNLDNPYEVALELAAFLKGLQSLDTTGAPLAQEHNLRGVPLATRDKATREAIAALSSIIDTDAATAVWEAALEAPDWQGAPVWFHGDVLPGNLLFKEGHLHAVIDFGGLGVGDPACDLIVAWSLFSGDSREEFRRSLGLDEATWARGRGHALSQALIFIPYYLHTNPHGVTNAQRALEEIFAEYG